MLGHSLESDLTAVKVFVMSNLHEFLKSITSLNFYIFGCELVYWGLTTGFLAFILVLGNQGS